MLRKQKTESHARKKGAKVISIRRDLDRRRERERAPEEWPDEETRKSVRALVRELVTGEVERQRIAKAIEGAIPGLGRKAAAALADLIFEHGRPDARERREKGKQA